LPRRTLGAPEERGQLVPRLGGRGAWLEPPDHIHVRLCRVRPRSCPGGRQRRPKLDAAGVFESLGHDANDGVSRTARMDYDLAAQHVGVAAEASAPGAMA